MPFIEPGAAEALRAAAGRAAGGHRRSGHRGHGRARDRGDRHPGGRAPEPGPGAIPNALAAAPAYLRDGQILILRSTVYPGVTALVEKMLAGSVSTIDVAFCPERIAEGKAMTELVELPQIVSGRTARGMDRAQRPVPAAYRPIWS